MDCPDWDYCAGCIRRAPFLHNPAHRFQPIYEVEVAPEAPTQPATAASQRYICILDKKSFHYQLLEHLLPSSCAAAIELQR